MPIESVGSHNPSSCSPSRSARSPRNVRRCTSTSSVNGAIVISPSSLRCASAATRRASGAASPGAHPLFCVSPATLTCSSTRTAPPCAAARRSSSSASAAESSECTSANRPGTCFALLRCRCPIKCHVARPPASPPLLRPPPGVFPPHPPPPAPAGPPPPPVELLRERRGVERVPQRDPPRHVLRLVALQVPDQVPRRAPAGLTDLGENRVQE